MTKKRTTNWRTVALIALTLLMAMPFTTLAQETEGKRRRRFSPEEFQAKQREYITEKAELTEEEADKFFPIFFELQKKKFDLERNAHKDISIKCKETMTEVECKALIDKMSNLKIEIATLEKEYIDKYLEVIPANKLMHVQRALMTFQRDLMKKMMRERGERPGRK
jgi:Spy/CpxP family protein refolding chaperone